MATITKIDITEYLLDKYQLQKAEAKALVEDFFEEIRLSLESGGEVKLSGFGNFELRNKASRPGRNPKTGESIPVSARRVVAFKPGKNYVLVWKTPSQTIVRKCGRFWPHFCQD